MTMPHAPLFEQLHRGLRASAFFRAMDASAALTPEDRVQELNRLRCAISRLNKELAPHTEVVTVRNLQRQIGMLKAELAGLEAGAPL